MQLKQIVEHHKRKHAGRSCQTKYIVISIDGVRQHVKGKHSLHMYCLRFMGCSRPYFVAVERGTVGYKVNHLKMVERFAHDIL